MSCKPGSKPTEWNLCKTQNLSVPRARETNKARKSEKHENVPIEAKASDAHWTTRTFNKITKEDLCGATERAQGSAERTNAQSC